MTAEEAERISEAIFFVIEYVGDDLSEVHWSSALNEFRIAAPTWHVIIDGDVLRSPVGGTHGLIQMEIDAARARFGEGR